MQSGEAVLAPGRREHDEKQHDGEELVAIVGVAHEDPERGFSLARSEDRTLGLGPGRGAPDRCGNLEERQEDEGAERSPCEPGLSRASPRQAQAEQRLA